MDPPSSQSDLREEELEQSNDPPEPSPSTVPTTTSGISDVVSSSNSNTNLTNSNASHSISHTDNTSQTTSNINKHNVDICITCVTDKPPQLPLREELPSLGIEVVYNAHGVGAKASKQQAKQMISKFRQDEQYADMKKRRFFAPSQKQINAKLQQRQEMEDQLAIPTALSYEKYDQLRISSSNEVDLEEQNGDNDDNENDESGSISTTHTTGTNGAESYTSAGEKRKQDSSNVHGNRQKKKLAPTLHSGLFQSPPSSKVTSTSALPLPLKFSFQPQDALTTGNKNNPFATTTNSNKASSKGILKGPISPTSAAGSMFQSVFQAFSGDHQDRKGATNPATGLDAPSVSESHSETSSSGISASQTEHDINDNGDQPRRRRKSHHHHRDIHAAPTPASAHSHSKEYYSNNDAASRDPSSHDVSRDPSSISTNFTRPDKSKPNPVEIVTTDPKMKKFLPGLQTVPSGGSSRSHSSDASNSTQSQASRNEEKHLKQVTMSGSASSRDGDANDRHQNHQQQQQSLHDAFAAFTINSNNDIYDKLGPKQRRKQRRPDPEGTPGPGNSDWMNTAKMAFENVAAEVYKQATGSASASSPSNAIENGNVKEQKSHQPLSPTSTLSSNTANQQQQQHVQIMFPNGGNSVGGTPPNKSSNVFMPPPTTTTHNAFSTHPHVEVHVRPDGTQVVVSSSIGQKSVQAFYEALKQPKTPVDSIQRMLRVCPGLVKVRLQTPKGNGRLGLHTACARGFPTHHRMLQQSSSSTNLALQLVEDIQQLKRLISVLVEVNRGACTVLDENGDLPAHLLARTLMEWEAQWYEKVYEKVQKDQDSDGRNAAAITKLYQSMSQCIETVLHPVAAFCNPTTISNGNGNGNAATTLCRSPGSVGLLLPLHVASIFTASVPTLRRLLEQDPSAATVPCNLGHLRTFIPDQSLPLELHDKLSTDFPKWEIGAEARKSKPIQITGGRPGLMMEDYMRRSDLLFAFHPTVPRFHMEKTRVERLEAKVISEAIQMGQLFVERSERGRLSVAVKRIWVWMCTFQNDKEHHFQASYYPSVKRVMDSVPASTIPYLSSIKTVQGKELLQVSAPECQALLRSRLDEYESTQAFRLEQMVATAVMTAGSSKSSVADHSYADSATATTNVSACLSLKGKGYVGVLCRTLFHIHEDSMPTSFILLPYKLTKNEQGKLGIDKKSSAATAVKFAECLLKLTDPKTILHFLEQKSDQRISEDLDDEASSITKRKCQEIEESLVSLYKSGKGYLYLIDELIGLPIVPTSGTSLYPIELTQPANIVRKLLPLMLTGMVLMRGEKALSVLVNVLLDKSVRHVSPNWVDASREIIAYLYSQQEHRSDSSLLGLDALIDELRAFVTNNASNPSAVASADSEWGIELSILRMVISMNDNKRSFAGLKAKRDEPGTVLWTKHKIEEEIRSEKSPASSKNTSDISDAFYHDDPQGTRGKFGHSDNSSKESTKKSGNHSADDIVAPVSPDSRRDIEKLRLQTTMTDSPGNLINAGGSFEAERKLVEDVSLGEADSGFDGEELAGVRILLEAEDGPSLLDQEETTEEEGTDSENALDKYKTIYDNESGNDSVKRNKQLPVKITSSGSGDSTVDDKDVYVDESDEEAKHADENSNKAKDMKASRKDSESDVEEALKFDTVKTRKSKQEDANVLDSPSQGTKNSKRSSDRQYDQSAVEEIDHSDENSSSFSAGKLFENETLRLQDYVMSRLAPSPPATAVGAQPSTSNSKEAPTPTSSRPTPTSSTGYDTNGADDFDVSTAFGEIERGIPLLANSSLGTTPSPKSQSGLALTTRSNTRSHFSLSKEALDSGDAGNTTMARGSKYGSENISSKYMTFLEMREQLTDQALKIDCLETTLESIRTREDKLLSRGEMLQDFLVDLVDQSENMKMDSEWRVQKVQGRLGSMEERILCGEIESQHLAFGMYAIEDQTEEMAEDEYKRELCHIVENQVKKRQQYADLDDAIGRSATLEGMRVGGLLNDSHASDCYNDSTVALDGYSNRDFDSTSHRALDGYSSRHMNQIHDYPYQFKGMQQKKYGPLAGRDYDMNKLLRNASIDERSIEYEMGLAMFGTLDHSEDGSDHHNGTNSLDAYERMRSDYQLGVGVSPAPSPLMLSSHDDASDDASASQNGYSSAGEHFMDMAIEGFDLDWVKLSARQLEVGPPHANVRAGVYQQ